MRDQNSLWSRSPDFHCLHSGRNAFPFWASEICCRVLQSSGMLCGWVGTDVSECRHFFLSLAQRQRVTSHKNCIPHIGRNTGDINRTILLCHINHTVLLCHINLTILLFHSSRVILLFHINLPYYCAILTVPYYCSILTVSYYCSILTVSYYCAILTVSYYCVTLTVPYYCAILTGSYYCAILTYHTTVPY